MIERKNNRLPIFLLRKISLFLIVFYFLGCETWAQNNSYTDSLEQLAKQYAQNNQDSLQSNAYYLLFSYYQNNNYQKAIDYCYNGIELGLKTQNYKLQYEWYMRLAILYQTIGLPLLAMENFKYVLEISEQENYQTNWSYITFGNFYYSLDNYSEAINYYLKAIEAFQKIEEKDTPEYLSGTAVALNNIGQSYQKMGKPDLVLPYFLKALELRKRLKIDYLLSHSYYLLGTYYFKINKPDSSFYYLNKGLIHGNKSIEKDFTIEIYLKKSNLFLRDSLFDKALEECENAKLLAQNHHLTDYLARVFIQISNIYTNSEDFKNAVLFATKSKNLADSLNNNFIRLEALNQLILINEKINNPSDAYQYLKEYNEIVRIQGIKEVEKMHFNMEIEQNQKQISKLNQYIRLLGEKNHKLYILGLIMVVLMLSSFALLYFIRKKNIELNEFIEQEKRSNESKLALAEILKNSVNYGNSLDEFLQNALETILSLSWLPLEAEGAIFVANNDGNLMMKAAKNMGHRTTHCAMVNKGDCLCGKAFLENKALIGDEYRTKFENPKLELNYIHMKMPISISNETLGVLSLCLKKNKKVSKLETDFFQNVCWALAGIIKQHKLNEILKKHTKEQDVLNQKLFAQSLEVDQQNIEIKKINNELEQQKEELNQLVSELANAKDHISSQHKNITDSINYAKHIQMALLPKPEFLSSHLQNNYFVLFKPKANVSGDFYYVNKINNQLIIAVGDCTGHGVPGAFITVLAITYLHDIVRRLEADTAGKTLDLLRDRFKEIFSSFGSDIANGLDIALTIINTENNSMQFAGANTPLWIVRNKHLIEYKATKNPIGFYPKEIAFKNNEIKLQNNDLIYLFSDGYRDQFGGTNNKSFSKQRFRDLIQQSSVLEIHQQYIFMNQVLDNWQKDNEQIDDITVLGYQYACSLE